MGYLEFPYYEYNLLKIISLYLISQVLYHWFTWPGKTVNIRRPIRMFALEKRENI
ncbi:hypothetical protein PBN151_2779 [Paenibacillus sp. NAIST15-1]|nr:hypothetical protein PBN151_2779 [Paenibacillus sp. NAIST15-1]